MTGLVYLAIIALWVMFLIPWLGRHRDEHVGRKSADRYHRAMDTLARARHRHESEPEVAADADEDLGDVPAGIDWQRWRTAWQSLRTPEQGRPSPALRRRRRVLTALGAAAAAAIGGAAAGVVPSAVPIVLVMLLAAYVAALVRATGVASAQPAPSAAADRYREAARRAQAQARGMLHPKAEQHGWDAVPTTLPTYVTKPRAPKVPRVVDLKSPRNAWNGEAMVQAAQEERRRAAAQQFEREIAAVEPDEADQVQQLADPRSAATQPLRRVVNG